ncbi:4-carboxymuconolactone decarboxylase, partial [Klebsiella pneumoniae]
EAENVVAQAAFYVGWPNALTAATVVGEVLRSRESKTE